MRINYTLIIYSSFTGPFSHVIDTTLQQVYAGFAYWFRLFLPETAPPNLPNCLPKPDFFAGAAGAASFDATGEAVVTGARLLPFSSNGPSTTRSSPNPVTDMSSPSILCRCTLLALSCTLRNFSSSSTHLMPPSSRPLRRFGRS